MDTLGKVVGILLIIMAFVLPIILNFVIVPLMLMAVLSFFGLNIGFWACLLIWMMFRLCIGVMK